MKKIEVAGKDVDELYQRLNQEAEASGYHLNPDVKFAKELIRGILINEKRYGYWACPCRLASGVKEKDLDVICPCDYRDQDLTEYDQCYCALYVSGSVLRGEKIAGSIPESRGTGQKRVRPKLLSDAGLFFDVWRCRVCGYLCARKAPPEYCPICKAKKDRFERFIQGGG